jgi:hypothetical protein
MTVAFRAHTHMRLSPYQPTQKRPGLMGRPLAENELQTFGQGFHLIGI